MNDQSPSTFRRLQWRMLFAAMFCYLFYYTGRQTLGFAAEAIQSDFDITKEQIGWIGTALLWCYAIGQFINGNLADKFGGRKLMALGAILSCAMNWVVSFSVGFWSILILWGINGYVQSMGWAPGSRVLSNWWGHHERGKVYGCYVFAAGMASLLAFVTSITVVSFMGQDEWRWIFRLPVLLMLVGGIVFYFVARETPEEMGHEPPDHHDEQDSDEVIEDDEQALSDETTLQRYIAVISNWRVLCTGLLIALQNSARYGLIVWVPVHFLGKDYKVAADAAIDPKWISIALPIGMAFGAMTNGLVSDKIFNARRSITIAIYMGLGAFASFAMLGIQPNQQMLGIVALFFTGAFVYGPAASIWALCPDLVKRAHVGTATGLVNFFSYLGAGLMEPVIGKTIDALEAWIANPDAIDQGLWAKYIAWVGGMIGDHPATTVVFVIVAMLCVVSLLISLVIRK